MLFSTSAIFGQEIRGIILDKNSREPLEYVSIFLSKNSAIGTSSDESGKFKLNLKTKFFETDSVSFSMVGYTTYKTTLANLKRKSDTLFLQKALSELSQVTIEVSKKQSSLKFHKVTSLKFRMHAFASIIVDHKLYISGGDTSVTEDAFSIALEKASIATMELTWEDILEKLQPNGTFKGYSDKLLIYNIEDDTWETAAVEFENRAYHQINYYNHELYILGGKKISSLKGDEYLHNTIELYNLEKQTVQVDHTNPHQAINFASFVYKDHIISMGGATRLKKSGTKVYTDKIHQFDLKTGLWYELGNLKSPMEVRGTLLGDKIYTIGGLKEKTSTIESWDITTGAWTVEGELFFGVDEPALASKGMHIYIYHYGKLLIYNVLHQTLKEYSVALYLKDAKMHIYKDSLYILGGYTTSIHSKDPTSGIYSIEMSEFNKTEITNFKNL